MLSRTKETFRQLSLRVAGLSPVTWMMAAFIVTYVYFFIRPIFLNPDHVMKFLQYVPVTEPIGDDLRIILGWGATWLAGGTPYMGMSLYPPLSWLIFAPLWGLELPTAYAIMTSITLVCYVILGAAMPIALLGRSYSRSLLLLFFAGGLFAYGFQFEVERGQFNLIAMTLSLLSVWVFHFHYRHRWAAYMLLTLAIQMKLWPAIFVLLFIRDWRDWRGNLRLVLGLGAANLALLFVLGPRVFVEFVRAAANWSAIGYPWRGNHSIHSFVNTGITALQTLQPGRFAWLPAYSGIASGLLLAFVAGALILIIIRGQRRGSRGPDAYLLLACTIAGLLVPSVSNDYKLSFLVGPVAVLLCSERFLRTESLRPRWLFTLLVFVFSLAYFSTLYSYMNKPLLLKNNLPALMVMLMITAAWALMDRGEAPEPSTVEA